MLISLDTARQLLDFRSGTSSITEEVARGQLEGAVALHNILQTRRVAYLADEVGMGKTYVALGAMALFRHYDPSFRVLFIAPRENIQQKWIKELGNFVRNNVRFPDLRVKAVHGAPARQVVSCRNLVQLVAETGLNPDRDFVCRLTSFSLPLGKAGSGWRNRRDELLKHLPWADPEGFDLRRRDLFKDNFARAVCAALPKFDLVIVDEGHNLKHGFGENVSARNRMLALAMGHPTERARGFPGYGPRARRVLFLSATPLENDYRQLWNQLHVFGLGDEASELNERDVSDEAKRACARQFLIRRCTSIPVGDQRLTKNLYRREWRKGGVTVHDDPLAIPDERQRLIVALVQKKVSEVLGHEKFGNRFQIGMLASFESFLETTKVRSRKDDDEDADVPPTFDDAEQSDDPDERLGIDVGAVNGLARSYLRNFQQELPHPKMDALVDRLAQKLPQGEKALVFVRRVASVRELQSKLEERYDDWLIETLRQRLPEHRATLDKQFQAYREQRADRRLRRSQVTETPEPTPDTEGETPKAPELQDAGGLDTFFAWFFRGEGPPDVLSGALLQRRFTQAGATLSTFFEDNYVAWLLGVRPGDVLSALSRHLGRSLDDTRTDLLRLAPKWLPAGRKDGKLQRLDLFAAVQQAALSLLGESAGEIADQARALTRLLDEGSGDHASNTRVPARAERWLEEPTFFTELRTRLDLRRRLWPEPTASDFKDRFREQELRRVLLSGLARLGHAFIDFYALAGQRLKSLARGARGLDDEGTGLIDGYLDLLERQMGESEGALDAFRELSTAADHFDLVLDVNVPEVRTRPLTEATRLVATLLGRQQPIGGMSGTINKTLVSQFRMPGYPFVLVTTDLLQEGEDLHTFCSTVHHYGISWMPSSMEQRVGRIDRVNSETERRLSRNGDAAAGESLLQVHYPHLRDTVEVLQVERVLERLNRFIRLMHRDLGQPERESQRLDVAREMLRAARDVEPILEPLESAFPVRPEALAGQDATLAVEPRTTESVLQRFRTLETQITLPGAALKWERDAAENELVGTVWRDGRQQPFTLILRSLGGRTMIRAISPIGRMDQGYDREQLARLTFDEPIQIHARWDDKRRSWLLWTEGEVLLRPDGEADVSRASQLLDRVTRVADDLEQHVEPGQDRPLADFRDTLDEEASGGA